MPAWVGTAAAILKLLGLVQMAERLIEAWGQRQLGMEQQKAADALASAAAKDRIAQADANAPSTRAELEDILRKGEL